MQFPSARIYVPLQRRVVTVHPGSLIGRLATASIQVSDPRVSEAHALVSMRSNRLKLIGLRGTLRRAGEVTDAIDLEQGTRVELAEGIHLFVEDVYMPPFAPVLSGAEQGPVELVATTYSLVRSNGPLPGLRLVPEYVDGAPGHLWVSAATLWIARAGADAETVTVGRAYTIDGCTVQVISLPVAGTSDTVSATMDRAVGGHAEPLVIIARYTSVHVHQGGRTTVIGGRPANLVSELVRFGHKPVPWDVVAREIWGAADDRMTLRQNLDRTLQRLRERLRGANVRENLVAPDGTGNIELVLHPGDRTVDET